MKVPTNLNLPTWVITVAIATLLVLTSAITYWLTPKEPFNTSIQDAAIEKSDSRVRQLEKEAASLTTRLEQLQSKPREIEYRTIKSKSKTDATIETDSVIHSLDFDGQAEFFTREITHLDSIRREYTGGNY